MANVNLNVSCKFPDPVLKGVQKNVSGPDTDPNKVFTLVTGPDEFLSDVHAQGQQMLDLVSHSAGDHFLLFLGYTDPDNIAQMLVSSDINDWMASLANAQLGGIAKLRLLGCVTAWDSAGAATMKKIKTQLNLEEVYGTKDWLVESDFDTQGFISTQKLVPYGDIEDGTYELNGTLPPPPNDGDLSLGSVLGLPGSQLDTLGRTPYSPPWPVRKLKEFDQDRFIQLTGGCEGLRHTGGSAPGLLALPTIEYWVPVPVHGGSDPNVYRVVQILGNGAMLYVSSPQQRGRIPFAAGAMFRVMEPEGLRQLMDGFAHDVITWRSPHIAGCQL